MSWCHTQHDRQEESLNIEEKGGSMKYRTLFILFAYFCMLPPLIVWVKEHPFSVEGGHTGRHRLRLDYDFLEKYLYFRDFTFMKAQCVSTLFFRHGTTSGPQQFTTYYRIK